MLTKSKKLEFIKTKDEISFISELIINMLKDTNQKYLLLEGEIGMGKTTLVKSISKIFKEKEEVISPSFNKMFIYENFVHIDAYNLKNKSIYDFEEYFDNKIVIIEWSQNLIDNFSNLGFKIEILYVDENKRKYIISWT